MNTFLRIVCARHAAPAPREYPDKEQTPEVSRSSPPEKGPALLHFHAGVLRPRFISKSRPVILSEAHFSGVEADLLLEHLSALDSASEKCNELQADHTRQANPEFARSLFLASARRIRSRTLH